MLYPKGWYDSSSSVMSVVVNSIKTRVPVFDTFNIYLDGLLHYGIRGESWHQNGIDLNLYRQGNYVTATVRKIYDEDELRFKYHLCGSYDVNSLSELTKVLIPDSWGKSSDGQHLLSVLGLHVLIPD